MVEMMGGSVNKEIARLPTMERFAYGEREGML